MCACMLSVTWTRATAWKWAHLNCLCLAGDVNPTFLACALNVLSATSPGSYQYTYTGSQLMHLIVVVCSYSIFILKCDTEHISQLFHYFILILVCIILPSWPHTNHQGWLLLGFNCTTMNWQLLSHSVIWFDAYKSDFSPSVFDTHILISKKSLYIWFLRSFDQKFVTSLEFLEICVAIGIIRVLLYLVTRAVCSNT